MKKPYIILVIIFISCASMIGYNKNKTIRHYSIKDSVDLNDILELNNIVLELKGKNGKFNSGELNVKQVVELLEVRIYQESEQKETNTIFSRSFSSVEGVGRISMSFKGSRIKNIDLDKDIKAKVIIKGGLDIEEETYQLEVEEIY